MTSQRDTLKAFTDAAADAVARAIASGQRDAQREREVRDAEHRARLAELDNRIASVALLERQVAERLATLKDGEPGKDGENGADGTSVSVEDVAPLIRAEAEAILARWERPKDGSSVTVEELAPLVDESVQRAVAALPVPKDGEPGPKGDKGDPGERGEVGERGEPGERGAEGPSGKLPIAREWSDRVHYEGEVVTHLGATYQALRDTGREPGHEDWICIASAGRNGEDGRSFTIRGTWAESEAYRRLDVVVLNGGAFAARQDDPGICPGAGWQMIAAQGKQGKPGERGPATKGERGLPGPTVAAMQISDDGLLRLTNADGSVVDCDLYPVLARLQ